ncbi:hypothetical protein Sps_05558 [Shewanella psychrophila]|uniref:Uncharacterized protein n=1 Tax=Shewanella psychrophila TaxID=225848 RepID=A0A1S6HYN7_9GAMM|nr:hypothetical protein [Shewanella psychrophila]AQS40621.1 hypothetical protein Sps_05558 [Shewanella psychrophila]
MANNIGDKQGVIYQTPQTQTEAAKAPSVLFKDKNVGLVSQASPLVSKQLSAQRLRHLLIDRFPQVPQQKIDELFTNTTDEISTKSLKDRQIKQV